MKKKYKVILFSLLAIIFICWCFYSPMVVFTHTRNINPYLALIIGNYFNLCVILMIIYFKYKLKFMKYVFLVSLVSVSFLSVYFTKILENNNFKNTTEISQYNENTHPVLRYYTSFLSLCDGDLIITDSKRIPDDYKLMKITKYDRSLHYVQDDGYSHALDLRSKDRSSFGKLIIMAYYETLGYTTIEHIGTATHIHIDDRNF